MRIISIVLIGAAAAAASSQTLTRVYNRDTHEPFHLKTVRVESQVIGPIVRTSTVLAYDNPYKTLTEATLNFDMPDAAALGGFAYWYGDEYVRGRLMDKNKAWFIYTAITSRNRDPGIMEQWSPTDYHCQIFPIKAGSDLTVRLWTVGMLQPNGDKMVLPKVQAPRAVGYETVDPTIVKPDWTVHADNPGAIRPDSDNYSVDMTGPVSAIAQRFKDGRIYVAGLIRTPRRTEGNHTIRVIRAWYGPDLGSGGGDVTTKVAEFVASGQTNIPATNTVFGDLAPYRIKRLSVRYTLDGAECHSEAQENTTLSLLAHEESDSAPTFFRIRQPKTVVMDPLTLAFSGWVHKNQKIAVRFNGIRYAFKPATMPQGNDTARLWAQQMLAQNKWMHVRDVLAFSLKYGVPSNATALLAVPKAEMKLYEQKEKLFEKQQAEQRRGQLQAERARREWAGKRNQNWGSSGGGDPEIRVIIPGAKSAEAILPDRRVIELKWDGDAWGGNFEIPADAAEGTYTVRVIGHMSDGSTAERSWTYDVKRTPPAGRAEFLHEAGRLILQVKAATGLAEVAAYAADGAKLVLREDRPGIYRAEVPTDFVGELTVVLKDQAGNKGELRCSLPR